MTGRKRERNPVDIGICYSSYREQRLARMGEAGLTAHRVHACDLSRYLDMPALSGHIRDRAKPGLKSGPKRV